MMRNDLNSSLTRGEVGDALRKEQRSARRSFSHHSSHWVPLSIFNEYIDSPESRAAGLRLFAADRAVKMLKKELWRRGYLEAVLPQLVADSLAKFAEFVRLDDLHSQQDAEDEPEQSEDCVDWCHVTIAADAAEDAEAVEAAVRLLIRVQDTLCASCAEVKLPDRQCGEPLLQSLQWLARPATADDGEDHVG